MSYPGGKGASGVAQTIINQQPPHDTYIEAFLGAGTIARTKLPARTNIGIDRDPSTIADFAAAGSRGFELLCTSAMDYILRRSLKNEWTGRELIYCDPPYLMSTRRSWHPIYRFEMDDNAHAHFLQVVVGLPCMVQISGYESRMYAAHLKGWRLVKYQAGTRHGAATECLWMNYAEPDVLHDFRFLGRDFRERERIRRKARRWINRLHSLPRLERLAISAEMTSSLAGYGDTAGKIAPDRTGPGRIIGSDDIGRRPSLESAVPDLCDHAPSELEVLQ